MRAVASQLAGFRREMAKDAGAQRDALLKVMPVAVTVVAVAVAAVAAMLCTAVLWCAV